MGGKPGNLRGWTRKSRGCIVKMLFGGLSSFMGEGA